MAQRKMKYRTRYACHPLQFIKQSIISRRAPRPRKGHRIASTESDLYVIAGSGRRSALTRSTYPEVDLSPELWRYNFASQRWHVICSNMECRISKSISPSVFICEHLLVSYSNPETLATNIMIYCEQKLPYREGFVPLFVTGQIPRFLYGYCIVIDGQNLYLVGGTNGVNTFSDIYSLNLLTKEWKQIYSQLKCNCPTDPDGRCFHEAICDGKDIYLLGGIHVETLQHMSIIPAYNLIDNRWRYYDTLPDEWSNCYPEPRMLFACVKQTALNGDIEAIISGGYSNPKRFFSDIWRLNLRKKQWTLFRNVRIPRPIFYHAASMAGNNCMCIFGGIQSSVRGINRNDNVFKIWLTVPKLSDMAWEAITHYNRKLHLKSRNALLQAGIPIRFVQRLHNL